MMTVFSIGLAYLAVGYVQRSIKQKYFAAFFFGLSLVVFMKVVPALAVIALVLLYEEIRAKQYKTVINMAIASLIPVVLFALYGLIVGALPEMFRQLIVEAQASYSVWEYPVSFGFYNQPNNGFIYGTMGTPITCIYVWILPILGGAGLYHVAQDIIMKKGKSSITPLKTITILLCVTQLIVLFKVPSVYLQQYLPLNWLFALFGGVAFDELLTAYNKHIPSYLIAICILFICFYVLATASITNNVGRSGIQNPGYINSIEARWNQIPANEPIFPGFLFRPQVYPVPFGYYIGNVPASITSRLPSIPNMLERLQLKHLILDEYTLVRLPADAQVYIRSHYTRVPGDNELMTRNP